MLAPCASNMVYSISNLATDHIHIWMAFSPMPDTYHHRSKQQIDLIRYSRGDRTRPLSEALVEDAPGQHNLLRCEHPRDHIKPLFPVRDYISGEEFQVAYCYSCKLHVTLPVLPTSEIGKYYPAGYYGTGSRFNRIVEWLLHRLHRYRVHQIEEHRRPGKVLDIGCGRGLLLDKLRQHGWVPLGTELSEVRLHTPAIILNSGADPAPGRDRPPLQRV